MADKSRKYVVSYKVSYSDYNMSTKVINKNMIIFNNKDEALSFINYSLLMIEEEYKDKKDEGYELGHTYNIIRRGIEKYKKKVNRIDGLGFCDQTRLYEFTISSFDFFNRRINSSDEDYIKNILVFNKDVKGIDY